MKQLMNRNGILNLITILIDQHPSATDFLERHLLHSGGVYDISKEKTKNICSKYPGLNDKLIPEEIALASGLHDVGRILSANQLFHELRGAEYIEKNALKLGVVDSEIDAYRVAQMFRPHFLVYEQFNDSNNFEARKDFEYLDSSLLLPRTWPEAIVVYSDLSLVDGERVSVDERIIDIERKYSNTSNDIIHSLEKGKTRLLKLAERVEKLENGKMNGAEIMQYGFL